MASVVGSAASAGHQQGWSDRGGIALKMEEVEAKHEDKMALSKKNMGMKGRMSPNKKASDIPCKTVLTIYLQGVICLLFP